MKRRLVTILLFAAIVFTTLIAVNIGARGLRMAVGEDPNVILPGIELVGLALGVVAAGIVALLRWRRWPIWPVAVIGIVFVVACGYSLFRGARIHDAFLAAAKVGPVAGTFACPDLTLIIVRADGRLWITDQPGGAHRYRYDPVTRLVTAGIDDWATVHYVPSGQSGSQPDWSGPGFELKPVLSVPGQQRTKVSTAWCPFNPDIKIDAGD